jgi:KDO2-lipid IV(A) lauroyltransferase
MKITAALFLLRVLSLVPLRLTYWLALPLAGLLYLMPWRKHRIIRTNLRIAFPDKSDREIRQLHRRNLVAMARLILELGAVWHWPARRLRKAIKDSGGLDELAGARHRGNGVLLIAGHHGNWEINALRVGLDGAFSGLYKAPNSEVIDRELRASRSRFGAKLIASGSPAMRQMLRALRNGETVGLLMDQVPRQGQGVFARFFGRPALTMTLVQRLARRTGCAVIFSDCRRLPGGRGWSLSYRPAPPEVAAEDTEVAVAALNQCLERSVSEAPDQYLWLYKRYAVQPEGWENPYRSPS